MDWNLILCQWNWGIGWLTPTQGPHGNGTKKWISSCSLNNYRVSCKHHDIELFHATANAVMKIISHRRWQERPWGCTEFVNAARYRKRVDKHLKSKLYTVPAMKQVSESSFSPVPPQFGTKPSQTHEGFTVNSEGSEALGPLSYTIGKKQWPGIINLESAHDPGAS